LGNSSKTARGIVCSNLRVECTALATGFAVLVTGLAFGTTRKYLETFVNNYFYPNKVNLSRDFVEILPEARSTISDSELLEILLSRVLEMFNITHGAIFLCDNEEESQFVSVGDVELEAVRSFACNTPLLNQVRQGEVVQRSEDHVFPLLVPLMRRQTKQPKFIGVLALGPMQQGRQYSLSDLWTFKRFASQAGTAIYIAQINTENYQKLEKKIVTLEEQVDHLKLQSSGSHSS
jgi:GAF domain